MKNTYCSPRWSGEILDCSMPMTFDTYNKCSYNCMYCFSFYQKDHTLKADDYQKGGLEGVNVEKVKKIFTGGESQFKDYVEDKKVMQWGGLADQFDEHERKNGVTLELLKFFKEINYPLCFSTKAAWWLQDDRYTRLFKGQKNWNCKFSIINLDAEKSKAIEKGCPTPQERIEAIRRYTELNAGGATLRLRPFIIGLSDVDDEYLDLVNQAAMAGATAVSTEFFCLEARANFRLKKRYNQMSQVLSFDIVDFYRRYSKGAGYKRLNYNIKKPYIEKMQGLCGALGLRFYVSDAHHKEKCHNGSCCGLPETWNYSRGQFTEALMIAKDKGKVYFSDISKDMETYKKFLWISATGFNTGSSPSRVAKTKTTMYEYIRSIWNTPNKANSPYKYFSGVLKPVGLDENNDVIYEYDYKKAE